MNNEDVKEIKNELIEANGKIAQALVELEYARKNDLVDENIEEVQEMIEDAEFELGVISREINTVESEEDEFDPTAVYNEDTAEAVR